MAKVEDVHRFWFGEDLENNPTQKNELWWKRPAGIDEEITAKFSGLLTEIAAGQHADWPRSVRGALARVLVLDQFPRHIFRGRPQAFAYDALALASTRQGIADGSDTKMLWIERAFFYLPLEHSEDLKMQELSVQKFKELVAETPAQWQDYIRDNARFADRHHEIVARFGRFPHRNAILGRVSTPEEIAFLKEPMSSF